MFFFIILKTRVPETSRRICEYREMFLKACVNKDTFTRISIEILPIEHSNVNIGLL